ncbi:RNA polymerase sigma factor SigV [Paenibacillus plantiphilus]|uniref:RNA polymerase sigma factor SigV n=1 Tax=Paenibacillus plantiphilus TaxID=2905650 RepID=A0ABM9C9G9_9BACL|nr:sigma-70 family RNA polymerase sigma factor [Paenibacillus plantiphilus]CAH1206480.1 RNA polymerase sigma factor SigV [Paenibacillus plantiphilus]
MERVNHAIIGDKDAFTELIMDHKTLMYRTAYSYCGNEHDAMEIVHETVYKAFKSIKNLREPAYFKTWLIKILINCAIHNMKRKSKVIHFVNEHPIHTQASYSHDTDARLDIQASILELEDKPRSIIILKFYHDMTFSQIADVLECPVSTVKTNYYLALKKLRLKLNEEECINE